MCEGDAPGSDNEFFSSSLLFSWLLRLFDLLLDDDGSRQCRFVEPYTTGEGDVM